MNLLKSIKSLFQQKNAALVLMYHRIADLVFDPWELAVSPAYFEQQLQILTEHYNVISVTQLLKNLQQKNIDKNSICLTFDDAYTDNYLFANPLLEKYNLPATFFVASAYIDQPELFWWDELQAIFLSANRLPEHLKLTMAGTQYNFKIDNGVTDLAKRKNWHWPQPPADLRCQVYLQIWEKLKPLHQPEIAAIMQTLTAWAALPLNQPEEQGAMSAAQLQKMMANPLFSFGAHTATHPALSHHPATLQQQEIATSVNYLAAKTTKNLPVLAYPYGDFNAETVNVVQSLSLQAAFTTQSKLIYNEADCYQLGRFHVKNLDGAAFKKQVNNWFKS